MPFTQMAETIMGNPTAAPPDFASAPKAPNREKKVILRLPAE